MAFKIASDPKFKATVNFKEPVGTDEYSQGSFIVEYRVVPNDVVSKIVDEKGDNELLGAIVVSIEGVEDEEGNQLFFEDGLLKTLCNNPYVRPAMVQTYFDMVNGRGAAEKN